MDASPTTARRCTNVRRPSIVVAVLAVMATLTAACGSNAPAPGEQLEVDGESPRITDPGGIANQLTNDEITPDD